MVSVRDLIVEAFNRTNLVPRKRELPSDMFQSGLRLLNGILQDYSTKGFIVAYQSEVDFFPKESILIGEGVDAEVSAPKIIAPMKVLYQQNTSIDWVELEFISYAQFYSNSYSDYIVSWQPVQERLVKLYFKPRFVAQNRKCKLIYNVEMVFGDNDTINLPTPYVELLTRALAYRLCIEYPRVDPSKVTLLKSELDDIKQTIEAQNSSNRIITREGFRGGSLLSRFDSGSFIW